MRTKGTDERSKRRNDVHYEQLILELPLHRPPAPPKREADEERDRGLVVIELY